MPFNPLPFYYYVLKLLVVSVVVQTLESGDVDLPPEHIPLHLKRLGLTSEATKVTGCWGYEDDCDRGKAFTQMKCPGEAPASVRDKKLQENTFFDQTDFGFVRQQIREQSLMCEPFFREDSSLECSKYLRFCNGRNILVDFRRLKDRQDPVRYHMDVLGLGEIAGHCKLHEERFRDEMSHVSALQSWAPELRFFTELPHRPIESGMCDVVIEKPTIFMKIDATVNMYHHFCDFFNLYASLHVNSSSGTGYDPFRKDVHILIWETYKYMSPFGETFEAFTKNPLWDLNTFKGKTVCFKNLMLPLLPRMIFGLFYNTPIISGCEKSGMFRAFSEFILHRLNIPVNPRKSSKIRITFLSRGTKYRRVINEAELLDRLRENDGFEVQSIVFSGKIPFREQLEVTRNTDLFIGMHGAGLTHMLFLPNWASVFELYNCEDPTCYSDLARLRGLHYVTWERNNLLQAEDDGNNTESQAYAKFTNYFFDPEEFLRLVNKAADHVTNHPEYKESLQKFQDRDEL